MRQGIGALLLAAGLCLGALPAQADWACEEKRIQALIAQVESSGAKFHRNGEAHDSKAAAQHLQLKLQKGLNSWFTPPKEEWTAELFIEKLATGSSWSGEPYRIEPPGQPAVLLNPWLKAQLKALPTCSVPIQK